MINTIRFTKKRLLTILPLLVFALLILTSSIYGFSKIESANSSKQSIPELKQVGDLTKAEVIPTPTPTPSSSFFPALTIPTKIIENIITPTTLTPTPTNIPDVKNTDDQNQNTTRTKTEAKNSTYEQDDDLEDIHNDESREDENHDEHKDEDHDEND